ncbi:MAG: hypothetical protein KF824_12760 [Fimbriimonadaceae bacterium]|nr:MAG: hypothetical protein KF824_12760 [Fimbriimonadaceae bacterium]
MSAIFAGLCLAQVGHAQTHGRNTFTVVGVTNNGFDTFALRGIDADYSETGGYVQASGTGSYSGLNRSDELGTMTYSGFGSANSQYGILKTYGWGSLSNSFYNSSNEVYYNPDTDEVNPNGTPDRFVTFGQAQYSDYFQYSSPTGNISAGVKVDFWYYVHGTLSGDSAFHSILVENDGDSDLLLLESDGTTQNINQVWTTKKFTIGADLALQHSTTIVSQFDNLSTKYWGDNTDLEGTANFGSTITLGGMHLYDENDNLITEWTMTALSGTDYQAVPEPFTFIVLGAGALAALKRKRI